MAARLGFLLQGQWPHGRLYPGIVEVFRGAESLGVHTGWLAQHHFERGRTPSPLTLLAAVGSRTERIGLGTATIMLPFEQPIRLAEDAATIDQIAPGRLQLGLGSGFGLAYNATAIRIDRLFRVDSANRAQHTEAVFDQLLHALGGTVDEGLTLEPEPRPVRGRIWRATSSPATAEAAGERGVGLLVSSNVNPIRSRTDTSQLDLIESYRASGVGEPRVGVLRTVRVGTDPTSLRDELFAEHRARVEAQVSAGGLPPGLSPAEYLDRLSVHYGDGRRVADSLRAEATWPSTTELIVLFSGRLEAQAVLRTLEAVLDGLHC